MPASLQVSVADALQTGNETDVPDLCMHQLFEAAAARVPNRPALVFADRSLTYSALNRRANQLAHRLRALGVGPNDCVALCFERSLEMIVALLGILKAGGAYVPLLPESPKARLAHQLAEIEAKAVVTSNKLVAVLPETSASVVALDRDEDTLGAEPTTNPKVETRPKDLVYVIYTSGSTGTPKGVAVRHENVVNYTTFLCRLLRTEEHDAEGGLSFATVSTLAADLGNTCIFPSLASGGTLHVIAQQTAMDGNLLAAYADKQPIDVLKITPSHLNALLAIPDAKKVLPRKYLVTGGEATTWGLVDKVRAQSGLHWINHYGPTETTIGSLTLDLDREERDVRTVAATVPIGRPMANTRLYVLDEDRRPVKKGEVGELYIAGRGVTSGYLKQPDRTKERFLPEPGRPDDKMYWTGDRVRELPNGAIEFLGRADNQVKIRGFRVELGEIEAVLRTHPGVREVVVVAREIRPQDLRVIAFYVPREGVSLEPGALRDLAKERLPDAMVPTRFLSLSALPLTPNGKVDKKALVVPESGTGDSVRPPPPAPKDELEAEVTTIWRQILGVRHVEPSDSFFELGGHSLAAVQMLGEVQKKVGKRVPNDVLLNTPTIEGIVAFLRTGSSTRYRRSLVAIQPKGTRPPLFCVHGGGGEVFWYRDLSRRLGDDQPFYGLQARRDEEGKVHTRRVEEMATLYLAEIREAFPKGPYYLSGGSFGGKVAYEMAQMLRAAGETVALVAMFDTWGPGYPTIREDVGPLTRKVHWVYQRLDHHIGSVWQLENHQRWPYLRERFDRAKNEAGEAIVELVKAQRRKRRTKRGERIGDELMPTLSFVAEASRAYVPKPYPGHVVLFKSKKQPLDVVPNPTMGWSTVVSSIEVHELPGIHATMIVEPRVRFLAEKFAPILEAAQEQHG